jgi:ent-copalyl diphosphate synthase
MLFFRDNLCKLEDENAEHMPIGFEVAFPSLLEIAKKLDIEVPYDSPVLQEIYASRNLKLTRLFHYTNFSHNCVSYISCILYDN